MGMKLDNLIIIDMVYYLCLIVFVIMLANLIANGCVNLPVWKSMFVVICLIISAVWRDKLKEDRKRNE